MNWLLDNSFRMDLWSFIARIIAGLFAAIHFVFAEFTFFTVGLRGGDRLLADHWQVSLRRLSPRIYIAYKVFSLSLNIFVNGFIGAEVVRL